MVHSKIPPRNLIHVDYAANLVSNHFSPYKLQNLIDTLKPRFHDYQKPEHFRKLHFYCNKSNLYVNILFISVYYRLCLFI